MMATRDSADRMAENFNRRLGDVLVIVRRGGPAALFILRGAMPPQRVEGQASTAALSGILYSLIEAKKPVAGSA